MSRRTLANEEMARRARRPLELVIFLVTLCLYCAWSVGVVTGWAKSAFDPLFGEPPTFDPRSVAGQAADAFTLVTGPYVVLLVIILLSIRALKQRQRRLAAAFAVSALAVPIWELQRIMIQRPRPESAFADSVSAGGYGYPAGHMVAATVIVWVAVTLANAQRKTGRSQWSRRTFGLLLICCAGAAQWAMGTQYGSDLVGGVLLGVTVASGALWISGVDGITRSWRLGALPVQQGLRAAVIYNPIKVVDLDLFRRRVSFAMASAGWEPAIWIETQRNDPGRTMAQQALAMGVDRVFVAGGDGTARTVAAELAGTGTPLALIPAGTGNLLGRNLRIPLDEDEALDIALHGTARAIDVVEWTANGVTLPFTVMAGVGLDAQIMSHTNPHLKKVAKSGAYIVAGILQARMAPFRATISVDGAIVHDGPTILTLVGNVGRLPGGVALIPSAEAGDGLLHLLIASRGGVRGLLYLLVNFRRSGPSAPLRRLSGSHVSVVLDRPMAYQLDGDTEGLVSEFEATVRPSNLVVMVPR